MAQLTQQQVVTYNKKVEAAKQKASQDKARKELAEQELGRTCAELSELLGKEITPENLEAEYAAFKSDALKTMESGTKIIDGLEREAAEASSVSLGDDDGGEVDKATPAVPSAPAQSVKPAVSKSEAADLDLDDLLDL